MESSSLQHRDLLRRVRGWQRVPALRLDLRFVRSTETGLFRVCDPKTQKYVELYELECLVAQAMDGEHSSDDLTALAQTYNPEITPEQVEELIVQLVRLGLLEDEPTKPGHGKVIPLPVPQPPDEFSAFRNEVVLDLQRNEALTWSSPDTPTRRAPFFAQASTAPVEIDDEALDNTTLSVGSDPFVALEAAAVRHSATKIGVAAPVVAPAKQARSSTVSEFDIDTVLVSPDALQGLDDGTPLPARAQTPVVAVPTLRPSIPNTPRPAPPPREPEPEPEAPADDGDAEPEAEAPPVPAATPESVDSEQENLWNQSHAERRWYQRWWVRTLALVAAVTIASMVITYPLHITAECAIIPAERVYVRSPLRGVIAEILVDEGAHVHKGDVIVRLDDRDLEADKRKAEAEVERIAADLQRARHGARPEEISQQRAILQARETAAAFAQKEAVRRSKMVQEGVGSKQAQDEAELDLHVKQNAAAEAASALRLLEAGTRPEEIAALEAAQNRAKAELDFIDQKLREMIVIRAPMDGVVLTPKFREHLRENVDAGGLICEIADTSVVHAEVFVPEREADTVAIGFPVVVKVESYPLHPFNGVVDFIAPAVEVRDGVNVMRVTAKLDNSNGMLRQDLTGYGEIEAGRRTLFDLATRRLLRWIRVRFLI
jgi:multidrug resistance efflux pump